MQALQPASQGKAHIQTIDQKTPSTKQLFSQTHVIQLACVTY